VFQLPEGELTLGDGKDSIELRMTGAGGEGVSVTKVLTFRRGSYRIDTRYEIANTSQAPVSAHAYFQLPSPVRPSTPKQGKYQKVDFSRHRRQLRQVRHQGADGWVAMVQHYFVERLRAAWQAGEREFFAKQGR
jgi:YidC/Oxa1 family membrane protein insertase